MNPLSNTTPQVPNPAPKQPIPNAGTKTKSLSDYLSTMKMAALCTGALSPFLLLTDFVKLSKQKDSSRSALNFIFNSFKDHKFGLFTGSGPNYLRRTSKDIIKWTLIDGIQEQLSTNYTQLFKRGELPVKAVSALSLAAVDCAVLFPADWTITQLVINKKTYADLKQMWVSGCSPYQGVHADILRQSIGWLGFMCADHIAKQQFDKLDTRKEHSFLRQAFAGLAIAATYCTTGYPFDVCKVRMQTNKDLSLFSTFASVFKDGGISKFYVGASAIAIQIFARSMFMGPLVDYINKPASPNN